MHRFPTRDTTDCNVICFTWLMGEVLDTTIQPVGISIHRTDRNNLLYVKNKCGGVCFMINNSWCDCRNVQTLKTFYSSNLDKKNREKVIII